MLRVKKVCCEKCGRLFSKIAGGIISTPTDRINICSKCKLDYAKKIFSKIEENESRAETFKSNTHFSP